MRFGDKLKQMVDKGLGEIGQELVRLGVQGQAEIASGLFTGSAYVPYGQGQNRDGAVNNMEGLHRDEKNEIQQENDGRSM